MADINLGNIEDTLRNIKRNAEDIKDEIRTNKKNKISLDAVESALKGIKGNTGNIVGNTANIKNGIEAVARKLSKLDALSEIQKWVKNEDKRSKDGGAYNSLETGINTLVGIQSDINRNVSSIAGHASQLNATARQACDFIREIKEHIVDSSSSEGTNGISPANGTTGETEDIHSTIKDILKVTETIAAILEGKTLKTGDEKLDAKLQEIAEYEADQKKKQIAIDKWLNGGDPPDGKTEKAFLKEYQDNEKTKKERQKKLDRAGKLSSEGIARGIEKTTGFATGILDKPTIGNIADKGIGAISQAGPWGAAIGGILTLIKNVIALGNKHDKAGTDFARTVGGGYGSKNIVVDTVKDMYRNAPARAGYTTDAAYSAMTEVAESLGRTTERLTRQSLESAIDLKRFGIGGEAIRNFDSFGKSLSETDRYFSKLYGEVSKKGLSFKNVSKAVNDNLKMAQSHTFANGLRGLQAMAEKSTQLKYNMQQVFTFADKVSDIEGAISTAANLSVLGGSFAQFSNPMQLLYEGLNDTEALNDRMVKMFGGKTYWNAEKGEMEMTALQREFVKAAAAGAGLSPDEMLNMSYNEGKMRHIEGQLGKNIDKDVAEYIKNIAEIRKNGTAYVNLNGEERRVSELTNEDKEVLKKESESKTAMANARLGDIWQQTTSIEERLNNILEYLKERLGLWVYGLYKFINRGEGRRQDTLQSKTGDSEELKQLRLNYYTKHSGDKGVNKNELMKQIYGWNESVLRMKMGQDEARENYPGGFSASLRLPGGGVFDRATGLFSGKSHFNGGIKARYRGRPVEIEGTESLLGGAASALYRDIIPKMRNLSYNPYSYANDLIKNNMGQHYNSMNVAAANNAAINGVGTTNSNVSGNIKIDMPQTITLNLAGYGNISDIDVSKIITPHVVDIIAKELFQKQILSTHNKETFYDKSVIV